MWSDLSNREVEAGYLIVAPFEQLFRSFAERLKITRDWYAIPRIDRRPEDSVIKYRGLDRDAHPRYPINSLAGLHLDELEESGHAVDGLIFDFKDVQSTLNLMEEKTEVVWTRECGSSQPPPADFVFAGIDPTYFLGDHFSASCDCMMFTRWHGTDKEGTLFLDYFRRLNPHGLFDSRTDAEAFLNYYLSFPWTETGRYSFAEVYLEQQSSRSTGA